MVHLLLALSVLVSGWVMNGYAQQNEEVQQNATFNMEETDFFKEFKAEIAEDELVDEETLKDLNELSVKLNQTK